MIERRCKNCIYWQEKWIDREEKSTCNLEPITIRKDGNDFCSHFENKYEEAQNE
jgi:hypothetical protein